MTRRASFAGVVLDFDTRDLVRGADGGHIHVSPKALALLMLLVDERPRALSKRELHERLWPDTFVSDATLASLVSELRTALDDHERGAALRTVHGFGYALAADVDVSTSPRASAVAPVHAWLVCDGREHPLVTGTHLLGRDSDSAVPLGVARRVAPPRRGHRQCRRRQDQRSGQQERHPAWRRAD
jgi:DNA-binding winged helix-turn-helix (wHTH) protein